MATSIVEDFRVLVIGEKGAGKSTIANKLFGFDERNGDWFPERGDPAAVAYGMGCHYLRKDEFLFPGEPNTTIRRVHVVEALGFPGISPSPQQNWNDIICSFEFLKKKVNVFLLVLNVQHSKNSEVVTRAVVDFFGTAAGLNAMVLFTHNAMSDETMANRFAMVHHGAYLDKLLGRDVPYQVLPIHKWGFPRREILHLLSPFMSDPSLVYGLSMFEKAQIEYLQKWVKEMRSPGKININNERRCYEIPGVPFVLLQFRRYFTEQELRAVTLK